jgi:peptide-methionine (S)-S-oxide reductase
MLRSILAIVLTLSAAAFTSCTAGDDRKPPQPKSSEGSRMSTPNDRDTATLAGGCFWCVEAVFQLVDGVEKVESGYCNGAVENPTYKEVCSGTTGHAEACRITFNPAVVSYEELLQVFFASHDPTTLNRQGNDVGTQYRSAIFVHSEEQANIARAYIKQLDSSKTWSSPIVTEVTPAETFYVAEDYHQNYYNQNGSQPYCAFVVRPKVEKFKKMFGDKMRAGEK